MLSDFIDKLAGHNKDGVISYHLTEDAKKSLQECAKSLNMSTDELISRALIYYLRHRIDDKDNNK